MVYRVTFKEISSRPEERIDRYEFEATRDNGATRIRLSGILPEDIRMQLIGQAPLEGVRFPADADRGVDDLLLLFTVSRFESALRNGSLPLAMGEGKPSALTFDMKSGNNLPKPRRPDLIQRGGSQVVS